MESPPKAPLPPIDECLFGPSRQIPKIEYVPLSTNLENEDSNRSFMSDSNHSTSAYDEFDDGDDPTNIVPVSPSPSLKKDTSTMEYMKSPSSTHRSALAVDDYDNFHLGHWGLAAAQHDIPMAQLRKVVTAGIPDEGSCRAIAWRVLLNYLPNIAIHESWTIQVSPKRDFYKQLVEQYFESYMEAGNKLRGQPYNKKSKSRKVKRKDRSKKDDSNLDEIVEGDRPAAEIERALPERFREQWRNTGLTLDHMTTATSDTIGLRLNFLRVPDFTDESTEEDFADFLGDATLLEEIRKDVSRTLSHLLFFLDTSEDLGLRRYAALERILFLWAKLNKGVRYVQGMNEIAGTLYFVLANDENYEWADHAEADTYFLFHTLMMDIRDVFVPDMDAHSTGIQGRIGNFQRLLQTHDPVVSEHLQACGIDSHFYAYRWLTTLLSREFLLPDTIRLWDSMFASTHKENFLRYVCVTMVMYVREDLLQGDFSANLRLLQRYPCANVDAILESSRQLWMYETKVGMMCKKRGIGWNEALQYVSRPSNIIMAFGYKGGVPPNFQDLLENATGQIMGRAQRLWSGWGKDQSSPDQDHIESTDTPTFAPTANPSAPGSSQGQPPPRSRLWDRVRSNTNDSEDKDDDYLSSGQEGRRAISEGGVPSTSIPAQPRSRLWNRGRSNSNESDDKDDNSAVGKEGRRSISEGEITPSIPPSSARSRLWNRGRSNSNDSDDKDDILTMGQEGKSVPDGEVTPSVPPNATRTRIWNRVGGNTNDSDENDILVGKSSSDGGIDGTTTTKVTPNDTPPLRSSLTDPSPRRRIWNRNTNIRSRDAVSTTTNGITPSLPSLETSVLQSLSSPTMEKLTTNGTITPQAPPQEVNPGSLIKRSWNLSAWKTESTTATL